MKLWRVFFVTLGVLLLLAGLAKRSATQPSTPNIKTVWIILMENHNWSQILGSKRAPYINSLLPSFSHAEQYFNPPGNHPSLPNYLWLEAGTNFGILNDDPPSVNSQPTTQHLVTFLKTNNISWKTYQENIDGMSCPLVSSGEYAVRHNPFVYFDDVTSNLDPNSTYCLAHVRPFTEMASDLAPGGTVAQYNFITPNLCDDMHDKCKPYHDPIEQGDIWLHKNLQIILNSAAYNAGGAVFITWDEAATGDGPIGMIIVSPFAKVGYQNSIHYTHGSTLRTMQEIFGVTPLLNDAAAETDLSDLFSTFP
jgi:phospholipase C